MNEPGDEPTQACPDLSILMGMSDREIRKACHKERRARPPWVPGSRTEPRGPWRYRL